MGSAIARTARPATVSRPQRDTTAGRAYLDLQARARRDGRPTDELLQLYVLERFLYRLSESAYRDKLVLKGGMLLAVFDRRRPTRDIDLLARYTSNDIDTIASIIRSVGEIVVDDGVVFDAPQLTTRIIREQDRYSAVRVTMPTRVARARQRLQVDINVGDPVTPAPVEVSFPALLGEPFELLGYPIETVLAEKIVTMIDRGDATTRERDFADVVLLVRRHDVDARAVAAAVVTTADHRDVQLRSLRAAVVTLGADRQVNWLRYVARAGLQDDLPSTYDDAIGVIADFAEPILREHPTVEHWNAARQRWE